MAIKELQTRIALKYDSYENWTKDQPEGSLVGKNLVLLAGEIGICEIPAVNGDSNVAPTVLFKVGNGTDPFHALPWASAKAADVYGWAKKSEAEFKTWLSTTAGFATDIEVEALVATERARIAALEAKFGDKDGTIDKQIEALDGRLDVIEGSGEGSVAKALKDAKAYADGLAGNYDASGSAATALEDAKDYTDTEVEKASNAAAGVAANLSAHEAKKTNPHEVTAEQVGLGKVENKTVAEIKTEFTGEIAADNAGFVTGGAAHAAIEAAKTAANTYADGLNTAMDTRVDALEAAKTAQDKTNSDLNTAITDEAAARDAADIAIDAKIGTVTAGKTVVGMISDAQTAATTAAASDAAAKVRALADGQVETNRADIAAMDTAYKAADNAIKGRLNIVEGKLADVTNVMDFRGAVEDLPASTEGYQDGDVIVVTKGDYAGREFVASNGVFVEFGYADGNTAAIGMLDNRMGVAETDIDQAQADISELKGKAEALETDLSYKLTEATFNSVLEQLNQTDGELGQAIATKLDAATFDNFKTDTYDKTVATLNAKDTELAGKATALENITKGYTGESAIKNAVDAKLAADTFNGWKNTHENDHAGTATEITEEITNAVAAEESARVTAVSDVDAKVTALTGRVGTAEGKITTAEGKITVLEGKVKANEDVIAALDTNYVSETEFTTFKTTNTSNIAEAKKAGTDADAKAVAVAGRVDKYDTFFGVVGDTFPTTLIFNCGSATEVTEQ